MRQIRLYVQNGSFKWVEIAGHEFLIASVQYLRSLSGKDRERSRLLLLRLVERLLRCHRHDPSISRHEVAALDQLHEFRFDIARNQFENEQGLPDFGQL